MERERQRVAQEIKIKQNQNIPCGEVLEGFIHLILNRLSIVN